METGHNFRFWWNALKASGYSLKDNLECFNTLSNVNVHSVSVIYILVIFKCEIEFAREPDNKTDKFLAYIHVTVCAHIV